MQYGMPRVTPGPSRPTIGSGFPGKGSRWWPTPSRRLACTLLDLLVTEDHELVTIIEGEGSAAADTRRITEWVRDNRPGVDVEVHHGGQPLYPYLFSIE